MVAVYFNMAPQGSGLENLIEEEGVCLQPLGIFCLSIF